MFRLVSLLFVILILGLMAAASMGSFSDSCPSQPGDTTTSVDVTVPAGLNGIIDPNC